MFLSRHGVLDAVWSPGVVARCDFHLQVRNLISFQWTLGYWFGMLVKRRAAEKAREREMLPAWLHHNQDPITITGIFTRDKKCWPFCMNTHIQYTWEHINTAHSQTHAHSSVSAWNDIPQSPGRLHGSVAMTTGYSCQIWSDIKIQWEKEGEQHRRRVVG